MTAAIATKAPDTAVTTHRPATFTDALRSEWTKIRSVPSTLWTLLAAAVLGIGLGALFSALAANQYSKSTVKTRALWDPSSISDSGLALAQLAIGVLGIMVITSEYSTRAIRTSLAAVPRRGRFFGAKTVVIASIAFVTGEIMAFAAFFIGQALIAGHAPTASLGHGDVLRAVFGSGLYLCLIGLLGIGLGTVLRSAAGAISALVAILYVLPGLAAALPASIQHTVERFWPTQAGQQMTSVVRGANTLPPWAGLGVMSVFVTVVLVVAFVRLDRRDA